LIESLTESAFGINASDYTRLNLPRYLLAKGEFIN
jgi:hypothetical protein